MLLVMIATGKGWSGTGEALKEGRISVDAAKELVDYFLLGGSGSRLAGRLGIKEVSLLYDETAQGFEVKKNLLPDVDAVYGIEQTRDEASASGPTTHKVGAEVQLDRDATVAVQGKRETSSSGRQTLEHPEEPAARQSVTVEYKKRF
jgi:hypothetical protein